MVCVSLAAFLEKLLNPAPIIAVTIHMRNVREDELIQLLLTIVLSHN